MAPIIIFRKCKVCYHEWDDIGKTVERCELCGSRQFTESFQGWGWPVRFNTWEEACEFIGVE